MKKIISFVHSWLPLAFIFLLTWTTFSANGEEKEKPNILFIISDDLTATAISGYENPMCQTPHIDKLASEGMRYTQIGRAHV